MKQRFKTPLDCTISDIGIGPAAVPIARVAERLNSLGPIFSPDTSIRKAIDSLGDEGGRIFLSEGVWDFGNANLFIKKPNVHLISTSPGNTIFRRTISSALAALVANDDYIRIEGIQFVDEDATNTAPMVGIRDGAGCVITNCVFKDVGDGVSLSNADWFEVSNCDFISYRKGITSLGNCEQGMIVNNRFRGSSGQPEIDLHASDQRIGIVGNVLDWSNGSIEYTNNDMASAANLAILNIVDVGNITER